MGASQSHFPVEPVPVPGVGRARAGLSLTVLSVLSKLAMHHTLRSAYCLLAGTVCTRLPLLLEIPGVAIRDTPLPLIHVRLFVSVSASYSHDIAECGVF